MKKILNFLAYPFVTVLAIAVNVGLFFLSVEVAVSFVQTASLIVYIFIGGIIVSKIKDKKIKIYSLIFTAFIMLAGAIACLAVMADGNDTAVWASVLAFPFSNSVTSIFYEHYLETIYMIAFAISAVLPVLISYIASKVFELKKKTIKAVLIAIMALICIGSAIQGAVTIFRVSGDSIYKHGEFYNAYYDMNGNKYESNEEVPYYDRNGKVYYYTYNHPDEEYTGELYSYSGEMTDENGKEYDIEKFYVYADGYIFMDEDKTVKFREDLPADTITDWTYVDSEGNICGMLIDVSYMSTGEPYFGMGNEYKTR